MSGGGHEPAHAVDVVPLHDAIQDAVGGLVAKGDEVGMQVVVIKNGTIVADVTGGTSDAFGERPVRPGDLFFAASTAKGILSSVAHVLAAQGELDYDMPIAHAWPQFSAHDKTDVTVRHVLMHQAGVPGLPADLTTEQLCDWDYMCATIADERAWWPAGTAFGYHAQTFGFLLGETLQRLTRESLPDLVRRTITDPLGIADEYPLRCAGTADGPGCSSTRPDRWPVTRSGARFRGRAGRTTGSAP